MIFNCYHDEAAQKWYLVVKLASTVATYVAETFLIERFGLFANENTVCGFSI